MVFCLGFLFFGAFVSSAGDASKEDLKRMQGKWKFVERIIDGKKGDQKGTWTFSGNEIIYGPDANIRAVLKIDAATKPKTFDFDHVSKDGKVMEKIMGIYDIEGDTFKICVTIPGKSAARPKAFESKEGSGHTLTVLQRVKDEK
jgi:uncharacterized protein (TIGR03067 family)